MKIISNFSNYSSVNFHQIYWMYVRISYTHAIKVLYCARCRTDTVHIAAVGVYIIKYLLPRVVCNYDICGEIMLNQTCVLFALSSLVLQPAQYDCAAHTARGWRGTDEIYATRGENWMQSIPLLIIWMVFGFVFEEAMRVSITAQTHTYTSHGWLNNWTYTGRPVELSRASRTMWLLSATIIQDAFGYGCWVVCLLRLHEQNRILPDYREPECC